MVKDFDVTELLKHFASKEFPANLIFYLFSVINFLTVGYVAHGYLFGFKELTLSQLLIIFIISGYISVVSFFIFLPSTRIVVILIEFVNWIFYSLTKRDKPIYKKWGRDEYAPFTYLGISMNNTLIILALCGIMFYFPDYPTTPIQTKIIVFLFVYLPIAFSLIGALMVNVEISYLSKENLKKTKKPTIKNTPKA